MNSTPGAARRPLGWRAAAVLLLFGTACALLLAELALRLIGYSPGIPIHERDTVYGWRNVRGKTAVVTGPPVTIDARGFRGAGFAVPKPPHTRRIFGMGCSVSIAVSVGETETYQARLQQRLQARAGSDTAIEVINAGVGGYSSQMGRQWLEHEIVSYQPDLLIIMYGWNDHWAARAGGRDRILASSPVERWKALLLGSRIMQALYQFRSTERVAAWEGSLRRVLNPPAAPAATAAATDTAPRDITLGNRVSLDEYDENLTAMITLARAHNSAVLLVTAPLRHALTPEHRAATRFTVAPVDGTIPDNVCAMHHLYTETVRAVGQREQVPVADAEAFFNAMPAAEREMLFDPHDYIHLNAQGLARLTEVLEQTIVASRLL